IEDDENFARTLVMQCHERGLKCLVAPTGEEGLALARKHLPNAVILDIKLPGIDGWQVLERIKEDIAIRHIPVHVMSAEEPSTKAIRKGAIGHSRKPVTREDLQEALGKMGKTSSADVKRLLVVEDDDVSRRAIVDLVSGEDVVVDQASGANEAIQAIHKNRYDCMILDLGLWDMDGEKFLEAVKKDNQVELPPAIVYTGRALSREEELRLREHTPSIIIKDVRSEERLLDEVSLFLHRIVDKMPSKNRQVIINLHDSEALFQGKKILVVEDDMRSAFAVSRLLTERGMKVFKAENGQVALTVLEKQPDINLVLMDIMMPVMDGYETTEKIRKIGRFAKLPIIALTAKAMKGDADKCFAVGANDYLAKPIDEERLLSMMRVWLYS
ncbi:MAG: response regulator, partial [Byssovorax sp.]